MTIAEMHYQFKQDLNAIDSDMYSGFDVPEIDFLLNRGLRFLVKLIAFPRQVVPQELQGFEISRRTIDDLYPLVKNYKNFDENIESFGEDSYLYKYPEDYWFFISGYAQAKKAGCKSTQARLYEVQHDDLNEESYASKSSLEWREINMLNINEGFRMFADNFEIQGVKLNYLIRPPYMHNAEKYNSDTNQYVALDGTTYTGTQDCILPEYMCHEVVDAAVFLAVKSLDLNLVTKADKLRVLGNLI